MKKVLFITFYFNQKNEIASKRLRNLGRYLPKYGWMPIIITPKINGVDAGINKTELPDIEIIETDYVDMLDKYTGFLKSKKKTNSSANDNNNLTVNTHTNKLTQKMIHIAGEIFAYPDGMKYWYKPAMEASKKVISENEIDGIISSSWPVTCHQIAKDLHQQYNIPWIADLRDLWNENPYVNHNFIRRHFEMKLERKMFRDTDILTVTSPLSKNILQSLHPEKEIYSIENGYDMEEFKGLENIKPKGDRLNITYAGKLYEGKRDPQILFRSIEELDNEGKIDKNRIAINFYGDSENILDIAKSYNLEDMINIHGFIDHDKVLEKEKESDILLLISWNNPKEAIFIPGKVFEYMGLQKPVISIGYKEGCLKHIINQTNMGYHTDNVKECKEAFLKYYNEFIKNGKIEYPGNEKIKEYTTENMTRKFAKILNRISN